MNRDRKIIKTFQKLALLLGLSMFFGMSLASPAMAQSSSNIDPGASASLTITKLEQPQAMGPAADGLPLSPSEMALHTPIAGVTFSAKQLSLGHPLNTGDGWREANEMTVAQALQLVGNLPAAAIATTGANGVVQFNSLGVGLFLIEEIAAPVGVVRAGPFLVTLPIQNPNSATEWLYNVHVYPKNAYVQITLDVTDRNAVALGDKVDWNVRAEIPRGDKLPVYKISNEIAVGQQLQAEPGDIKVLLTGQSGIKLDVSDYKISVVNGAFSVDFSESGRKKLAQAKKLDDNVKVSVSYQTRVTTEGEHTNKTFLCVSADCLKGSASEAGKVSDTAITKWGKLGIIAVEEGKPQNRIPGAKFKIYLTEEDALLGKDFIVLDGVSEWVTDANGEIIISGLRFSNFVDGVTRLPGDLLLIKYWVVMTHVPEGWQGSSKPLSLEILSTEEFLMQVAVLELHHEDLNIKPTPEPTPTPGTDPKPDKSDDVLSETGTKVLGALTLGVVLVTIGFMALARCRDEKHEEET